MQAIRIIGPTMAVRWHVQRSIPWYLFLTTFGMLSTTARPQLHIHWIRDYPLIWLSGVGSPSNRGQTRGFSPVEFLDDIFNFYKTFMMDTPKLTRKCPTQSLFWVPNPIDFLPAIAVLCAPLYMCTIMPYGTRLWWGSTACMGFCYEYINVSRWIIRYQLSDEDFNFPVNQTNNIDIMPRYCVSLIVSDYNIMSRYNVPYICCIRWWYHTMFQAVLWCIVIVITQSCVRAGVIYCT